MKTYRLIKKYPNSPKIGTLAKIEGFANSAYPYKTSCGHYCYSENQIENYPEFWEEVIEEYPIGTKIHNSQTNTIYTKQVDGWYKPAEKTAYTDEMIGSYKHLTVLGKHEKVVEKDYEILSYVQIISNRVYKKDKDGIFISDNMWSLSIPLESHSNIKIHSVKRLSDGEVFTIGDKINTIVDKNYQKEILKINIGMSNLKDFKNQIVFETKVGYVILYIAKKAKTPLFTTEDGVDIYEGDKFYWLDKGLNINNSGYSTDKGFPHITLYFSTKEKAEEYIIMNKPVLSLNDIKETILNVPSIRISNAAETAIINSLDQLVKQKLK